MTVKCATLVTFVEELAPRSLAIEGDNTGWQVGDPNAPVAKVLLALDVDEATVGEAVRVGANMIISHHPLIYRPLRNLRLDQPRGALVARLVREGISVYAAHTNLDAAAEGVSEALARCLGLADIRVLVDGPSPLGRVGLLPEPVTFYALVAQVKTVLELPTVRAGGPQERVVHKVALCGGSGGDLWSKAAFSGADVYITGDLKYHIVQDILAAGLNFIDPGHYPTERVVLEPLQAYLERRLRAAGLDLPVVVAQAGSDPFYYL